MSKKGKSKLNGQPPGLAIPKTPVRLSARSKWRRAVQKMEEGHKPDVDAESVPLTERESLSRQNSSITSGRNSGRLSVSQIPNVVQYDTKETVAGEDTDNPKKEVFGNEAVKDAEKTSEESTSKESPDTDKLVLSGSTGSATKDMSKVSGEATLTANEGVAVAVEGISKDTKENGLPKVNGSVVDSEASAPLSRLGNNISLKESLTVPGKATSSPGSKDADGKNVRKSSVLSFGRETTKLSMDSRKSIDARIHQFTTIQMPADDLTKSSSVFAPEDSWIKTVIPYMPLGVAVTCLVMNIIIPGSGTILSGVTVFCCGKSRVPQKYDQDVIFVMCVNTWVGVAQLFTVTFMLVGWFWSLAWGITMIVLSLEHRRELKELREKELKRRALEAFGTSIPGGISPLS